MDNPDHKSRLKAIGLTAGHLATELRVSPDTITRGLRGSPAYIGRVIDLLEIMSLEQRAAWLAASPR